MLKYIRFACITYIVPTVALKGRTKCKYMYILSRYSDLASRYSDLAKSLFLTSRNSDLAVSP